MQVWDGCQDGISWSWDANAACREAWYCNDDVWVGDGNVVSIHNLGPLCMTLIEKELTDTSYLMSLSSYQNLIRTSPTLAFGVSAQSVHLGAFPRRCGCTMMIQQRMTMEKAVEEVALRRSNSGVYLSSELWV